MCVSSTILLIIMFNLFLQYLVITRDFKFKFLERFTLTSKIQSLWLRLLKIGSKTNLFFIFTILFLLLIFFISLSFYIYFIRHNLDLLIYIYIYKK
jgi:hypothetical protein